MDLLAVTAPSAPEAIGPYVQAVAYGGVLYCSGSLPVDPATGDLDNASVEAEVARSLANLQLVCEHVGTSLDRAIKLNVYTTDLASFPQINAAYAAFFDDRHPARTTLEVSALPKGAVVEIDATVAL